MGREGETDLSEVSDESPSYSLDTELAEATSSAAESEKQNQ